MMLPSFDRSGIPESANITRLLYNRPANALIVELSLPTAGGAVRLYYRTLPSTQYLPVDEAESPSVIQQNLQSCPLAPAVIYNQFQVRDYTGSAGEIYADWNSVRRFDLVTGNVSVVASPTILRVPDGYVRGWISQILMAWPDGLGAVCVVGLERMREDGSSVVDSRVYDFSFDHGLQQEITRLSNPFS